jgi:glycerate kinase
VFGPQKGATPAQVEMLTRRLERLAQMFAEDFGADVTTVSGGGAAGGLGGALAAVGGKLVPGFELVADELNLYDHLEGADLVITGEGELDHTSFRGKVVGGITAIASESDIPVVAIVGSIAPGTAWPNDALDVVSLVERFGEQAAFAEPKQCIERAASEWLAVTG